jgi:HSP20 family protein
MILIAAPHLMNLPGGQNHMPSLIRWEPAAFGASATRRFVPALDVLEHEDRYVLRADLPGVDESDIDLSLDKNVLTLSGTREHRSEERTDGYVRVERATGAFRRSLTLPEGVDGEQIAATFDKGVLEVSIPKPAARRPRKLAITVGTPAERVEDAAAEQAATS